MAQSEESLKEEWRRFFASPAFNDMFAQLLREHVERIWMMEMGFMPIGRRLKQPISGYLTYSPSQQE